MFYSSSWTIFLKFKGQAIQESQISAKINPSKLQHPSDFSKNVLFFTVPWAQRHLGLRVNCLEV